MSAGDPPPPSTGGDERMLAVSVDQRNEWANDLRAVAVATTHGPIRKRCDRIADEMDALAERPAGLDGVAPPSPSPYFAMLPVTADACRERAQELRALRERRAPGPDPELCAHLTATIALLAAAVGVAVDGGPNTAVEWGSHDDTIPFVTRASWTQPVPRDRETEGGS